MPELSVFLQTMVAAVSAVGVGWAVFSPRSHSHPDLVSRHELALLRSQLASIQHDLREVRHLLQSRDSS